MIQVSRILDAEVSLENVETTYEDTVLQRRARIIELQEHETGQNCDSEVVEETCEPYDHISIAR